MEHLYKTRSAEETARFGAAMASCLRPGDSVYLMGELGSGKSVLARGIARALGVEGAMPSPTFTLMQPYKGAVPVYHLDLYRLEDVDEYYAAGLHDPVHGDGVALIEWPIEGLDAAPRLEIRFERGGDADDRLMALTPIDMDDRARAIYAALEKWERKT